MARRTCSRETLSCWRLERTGREPDAHPIERRRRPMMSSTLNPLRAVFALPPEDVDAAEFEAWHGRQMDELLRVEGVASARLYALQPSVGAGTASPTVYSYCGLYEIGVDHAATLERIDAAVAASAQPDFVARTRFAVYDLTAIDEIRSAHTLDAASLYLVFSAPPEGVSRNEFDSWYHDHVRENVEIGQLAAAHRWDAVASLVDPLLPPHATHVATYELTEGKDVMNRLLDTAIAEGRIVLPDWFRGITFGSAQITALTDRLPAS
jgi:hypothetical protein